MSFCQFGEILWKEKRSLQRFEVVKVGLSCLCGSKLPLDLKNGLAWNLVSDVMFTIMAGIEVLDFQVNESCQGFLCLDRHLGGRRHIGKKIQTIPTWTHW